MAVADASADIFFKVARRCLNVGNNAFSTFALKTLFSLIILTLSLMS